MLCGESAGSASKKRRAANRVSKRKRKNLGRFFQKKSSKKKRKVATEKKNVIEPHPVAARAIPNAEKRAAPTRGRRNPKQVSETSLMVHPLDLYSFIYAAVDHPYLMFKARTSVLFRHKLLSSQCERTKK